MSTILIEVRGRRSFHFDTAYSLVAQWVVDDQVVAVVGCSKTAQRPITVVKENCEVAGFMVAEEIPPYQEEGWSRESYQEWLFIRQFHANYPVKAVKQQVEMCLETGLGTLAVHRTRHHAVAITILSEGFNGPSKEERDDYCSQYETIVAKVANVNCNSLIYCTPLPQSEDILTALDAVQNKGYGNIAFVLRLNWAIGYRGDSLNLDLASLEDGNHDPITNIMRPSSMARLKNGMVKEQEEVITSSDSLIVQVVGPKQYTDLAEICAAKGIPYVPI